MLIEVQKKLLDSPKKRNPKKPQDLSLIGQKRPIYVHYFQANLSPTYQIVFQ